MSIDGVDVAARMIVEPVPNLKAAEDFVPYIATLDKRAVQSHSKQNSFTQNSSASFTFSKKEERMVRFMTDALQSPDVFKETEIVHELNSDAASWIAGRSSPIVYEERESTIKAIELAAASFQSAGWCDAWSRDCDPGVRGVAVTVNGPLCEQLAESTGYHDWGSFT